MEDFFTNISDLLPSKWTPPPLLEDELFEIIVKFIAHLPSFIPIPAP